MTVDVSGIKRYSDFLLCLQLQAPELNIIRGPSETQGLSGLMSDRKISPAHGLSLMWVNKHEFAFGRAISYSGGAGGVGGKSEEVIPGSFPTQKHEWKDNECTPILELRVHQRLDQWQARESLDLGDSDYGESDSTTTTKDFARNAQSQDVDDVFASRAGRMRFFTEPTRPPPMSTSRRGRTGTLNTTMASNATTTSSWVSSHDFAIQDTGEGQGFATAAGNAGGGGVVSFGLSEVIDDDDDDAVINAAD
jgi:hypothetical protein